MKETKLKDIHFISGKWPISPDLPTLIFIHGAGLNCTLWKHQLEYLKNEINVVAVDLPGHGKSGGSGRRDIAGYADDLSAFISELNPPKPVLCGLSMGGAVVLKLLIDAPETYIAGIVVNSGARLKVAPYIFETIDTDYALFADSLTQVGASSKTPPEKLAPLKMSLKNSRPDITRGDFEACDSFDVMENLNTISAPVLVLSAEDDQVTPKKYGLYLKDHINHAQMVSIEDAGHLSPMERPDDVSRAIYDFVSSLNK